MKLLHISDLHIGKRLYGFDLEEDQRYILQEMIDVMETEKPDAVLIAGDIYDRADPSASAVKIFDDFLSMLAERDTDVFMIYGNHDSGSRISYGRRVFSGAGIHVSPVYDGKIRPVCLSDAYGEVRIYMLPFIKPAHVRRFHEEMEIPSYTDAVRCAIDDMNIDTGKRNVLVTHQFVTGAARSDSEEISVGGSDNVDADVFAAFDYTALGHIHSPQNCGSPYIRYWGTPLKYSFSEAGDQKSVTVAELFAKGNVTVKTVPLVPRHDLVELKGTYNTLTLKSFYENTTWQEDYTHITLTDEEDIPDAIGKLRTVYHHLMKLDYDNTRTRSNTQILGDTDVETKTPYELFDDFYELQNNHPMSEDQSVYMKTLIEKTWEELEP